MQHQGHSGAPPPISPRMFPQPVSRLNRRVIGVKLDDGRKTFIQFPATLRTTEAPALFIRSAEGKTQLVNYRVKGNYYIVDRLFDLAELRVGEKQPIIVRIMRKTEDSSSRRAYRAAPRA